MSDDSHFQPAPGPVARRDELRVFPIDDEAVVYDAAHDSVHYLNDTARFIWQRCDGRRAVEDIGRELADAFSLEGDGRPPARVLADVQEILVELSKNGLVNLAGR